MRRLYKIKGNKVYTSEDGDRSWLSDINYILAIDHYTFDNHIVFVDVDPSIADYWDNGETPCVSISLDTIAEVWELVAQPSSLVSSHS